MPDSNIEKLNKETYLAMIKNSVGSRLFNSLYVRFKDSGVEKDVLNDGELSCAFFVSGILVLGGWGTRLHATVKTLREKLPEYGWEQVEINTIQSGDIVIWENVEFEDGTGNEHIGFALNEEEAVSTSFKKHEIVKHHITFGMTESGLPVRKISEVYREK